MGHIKLKESLLLQGRKLRPGGLSIRKLIVTHYEEKNPKKQRCPNICSCPLPASSPTPPVFHEHHEPFLASNPECVQIPLPRTLFLTPYRPYSYIYVYIYAFNNYVLLLHAHSMSDTVLMLGIQQ